MLWRRYGKLFMKLCHSHCDLTVWAACLAVSISLVSWGMLPMKVAVAAQLSSRRWRCASDVGALLTGEFSHARI